jgi:hypothetical protein
MPSSFSRQRVVWQEKIDKVMKAEQQLKLKSRPAFSSKGTVQEMLNLSAVMSKSTDQELTNLELKTDVKDVKERSFIFEAERFLQEFIQSTKGYI